MKSVFDGLIWVIFYILLNRIPVILPFFPPAIWSAAAGTVYWGLLFLHLRKRKQLAAWGIRLPDLRPMRFAAVLLWIPVVQCILYGLPEPAAADVIRLFLAALAEEMAFRVLLPKWLTEQAHAAPLCAVFLCSTVFALFHGLNLLQGMPLPAVLLQASYAFCAGLAFCALVWGTGSVLPSWLLHGVINLTAGAPRDGTAD